MGHFCTLIFYVEGLSISHSHDLKAYESNELLLSWECDVIAQDNDYPQIHSAKSWLQHQKTVQVAYKHLCTLSLAGAFLAEAASGLTLAISILSCYLTDVLEGTASGCSCSWSLWQAFIYQMCDGTHNLFKSEEPNKYRWSSSSLWLVYYIGGSRKQAFL